MGMRDVKLGHVVLNIGVGEGDDKLAKAERVLKSITGRKPTRTYAKRTIREWGIKRGEPIGCKVTLRGGLATNTLNRLFDAVERRLSIERFDNRGNFSFGIKEYIDIPDVSYDPEVGIFGIDVCVALFRSGYRIGSRQRLARSIPRNHQISKNEAVNFITDKFGIQVT